MIPRKYRYSLQLLFVYSTNARLGNRAVPLTLSSEDTFAQSYHDLAQPCNSRSADLDIGFLVGFGLLSSAPVSGKTGQLNNHESAYQRGEGQVSHFGDSSLGHIHPPHVRLPVMLAPSAPTDRSAIYLDPYLDVGLRVFRADASELDAERLRDQLTRERCQMSRIEGLKRGVVTYLSLLTL